MKLLFVWAIPACLVIAGAACGKEARKGQASTDSPSALAQSALPDGLIRVEDPSQICMVNDRFMGTPQIPVSVGGKTYFGCCAGCKAKLETQSSARTAHDPVSGEPVDKASALLLRDEAGRIFYFANAATLARFRR
jgi:YHS domain-containing protein